MSEDTKKRYLFSLIVVNLLSSPILQVEQQKVTVFYFLILFIQRFVGCTGYTVG